ncbi:sugar transferase [Halodesulfovibrio aestuarii]|uniref:Sugar transferase involved in LPS biosynthesis (Colanic, teichoic acid) n=1 Tax=Halodesulfovibrio aestuarii TaxID=126333 RepID=A0A8G2F885_9BACT|nr:sugar transferase [Halodesulfovibrio aestuarii]SHJ28981.1 Sugar transferase involved in LPS biosynthesis (colanic, teichoic acid) [Halodesulfovibrio aestuarii]
MTVKRCFDLLCSSVGLLALSPFFLIIAFRIKRDSFGPVFFRQERVGKNGVPFKIHKFRTMIVDSEMQGRLTVGKDSRITASGHFLRKYKLDELPQLIDVWRGDMSLVGPRPEVQEFINCYSDSDRRIILSVLPGITDLASISLVDENELLTKYDDPHSAYVNILLPMKRDYYLDYIKKQSFLFDLKIIFLTFYKVLRFS